ncbi:hypothetical protein H9P43_007299 [Blastocladiella emersonii ATCC 22665]|nr:hypothetical protein H9P43_007299 [Blastocladiella emersonii ATCC 22665]
MYPNPVKLTAQPYPVLSDENLTSSQSEEQQRRLDQARAAREDALVEEARRQIREQQAALQRRLDELSATRNYASPPDRAFPPAPAPRQHLPPPVAPAAMHYQSPRDDIGVGGDTTYDVTHVAPVVPAAPATLAQNGPAVWAFLIRHSDNERFNLTKDEYTVGRAVGCDIPILSFECSKLHLKITRLVEEPSQANPAAEPGETRAMITDLSTNGTFVDGRRLTSRVPTPLTHGCVIEIKIGNVFTFQYNDREAQAINDPEFRDATDNYLFVRVLGTGTYAAVWLVTEKHTGAKFACKVIDKRKAGIRATDNDQDVIGEIEVMCQIAHANVLRVHDFAMTREKVYVYLELAKGGELFDRLARKGAMPEANARYVMFQVFNAVKFLHDRNITHRDIKPENVLLGDDSDWPQIFLGDFGLAKNTTQVTRMKTLCGTLNYLAPEVLSQSRVAGYGSSVDCWSVGVMMFLLLSGSLPFDHKADAALKQLIKAGKFEFGHTPALRDHWDTISDEAKDLIIGLLNKNVENRLTMNDALRHAWIAEHRGDLDTRYAMLVAAWNRRRNRNPAHGVSARVAQLLALASNNQAAEFATTTPSPPPLPVAGSAANHAAAASSSAALYPPSIPAIAVLPPPVPRSGSGSSASGSKAASSSSSSARAARERVSQSPRQAAAAESPRHQRSQEIRQQRSQEHHRVQAGFLSPPPPPPPDAHLQSSPLDDLSVLDRSISMVSSSGGGVPAAPVKEPAASRLDEFNSMNDSIGEVTADGSAISVGGGGAAGRGGGFAAPKPKLRRNGV